MDYQLIKFILAALFLIGSPYIVVEGLYRILKSKDEKQRFIGLSHLWVGLLLFAGLLVYIFLHI